MRSYYDSFASIAQATSYTTKLLLGWQDLPIRLPVCVRIPTTVNHVENAAAGGGGEESDLLLSEWLMIASVRCVSIAVIMNSITLCSAHW